MALYLHTLAFMPPEADEIARLCLQTYESLPQGGAKPQVRSNGRHEWTVLAGAVVHTNSTNPTVVALATGAKCTPYERLSPQGDVLHDCHAEVLVRRGVRAWLLERLIKEKTCSDSVIDHLPRVFVAVAWDLEVPVRWSLAPHVRLSWYISMLPCGEASSSALQIRHILDDGHLRTSDTHTSRALLRGRDMPYASSSVCILRSKPGRADAPPSISMSCSDKFMLWNAVGIQGALLSRWLEPIYIDQVVLSWSPSLHMTQAEIQASCSWAFGERIHRANHSRIMCTSITFPYTRESMKEYISTTTGIRPSSPDWIHIEPVPCAASLLWIRGRPVEKLLGGIKMGASPKRKNGRPLPMSSCSSVCKRAWFTQYQRACQLLSPTVSLHESYYAQKRASHDTYTAAYAAKKEALFGARHAESILTWFLDTQKDAHSSISQPPLAAPLSAWLQTPRALQDFVVEET